MPCRVRVARRSMTNQCIMKGLINCTRSSRDFSALASSSVCMQPIATIFMRLTTYIHSLASCRITSSMTWCATVAACAKASPMLKVTADPIDNSSSHDMLITIASSSLRSLFSQASTACSKLCSATSNLAPHRKFCIDASKISRSFLK